MTVSRAVSRLFPASPALYAKGCACYPAALAHVTENIHFNWHQMPVIPIFQDPNSISQTDSSTSSSKTIICQIMFPDSQFGNTVTVIMTQ